MGGGKSVPQQISGPTEHRRRYSPLSVENSEIRLLSLLPGKFGDLVECRIQIENLRQTDLKYQTLSYVWGDSSIRTPILVDGRIEQVTANLGSALKYMRQEDVETVLWIDAICINQENLEEKTHQISIMGDIYKRCTEVKMWLGCDENMNFDIQLSRKQSTPR